MTWPRRLHLIHRLTPLIGLLALCLLIQLLQGTFERGLPGTLWSDLAYLLVMYASVALTVAAWRTAKPTQRPALGLFSLALLAFTLGDSVLTYYELVPKQSPDFSVADLLYYTYYLLMGAALLRLIRLRVTSLYALAMLVDSVIIMGIIWIFAWFGVLAGVLHQDADNLLFRWVSLSYVGLDLALLGLLLLTLRRQRLSAGLSLVILGLGMAVIADLEFSYLQSPNDHLDVLASYLWTWGTACQALGFWLIRDLPPAQFRIGPPKLLRLVLSAFPYIAVLACCVLMVLTSSQQTHSSAGVLWGTVIVFLLVLVRQGLVIQENVQLTRELRRSSADLERSSLQLTHQVYHDSLTELPNRLYFTEQLDEALQRQPKVPLAVLFIDLDGFKFVNDTFGHSAGDQLLQQVAQRLRAALSPDDLLARIGGDEFTVLLQHIQSAQAAEQQANLLIESLQEPFLLNDLSIVLTASIGVSLFPDHGQHSDLLQRYADIAMYHAKGSGKNRVGVFSSKLDLQRQLRYETESELRHAIERGEFELYYQPQFQGHHLVGVEVLLRWHNPRLGRISPDYFIPLAEETGVIFSLGRWVLRTACQQAALWQKQGQALRVAVNVSPLEFTQPDFVEAVAGQLRETGLAGPLLELEITEGVLVENIQDASEKLQALRQLGVRISVDDFGVGHSSLSHLLNLPADALKIDRSFLLHAEQQFSGQEIIRTVLHLGARLNLDVLVEGVETEAQMRLLSALGCDMVQGYLLALPMPLAELEHWLSGPFQEKSFQLDPMA